MSEITRDEIIFPHQDTIHVHTRVIRVKCGTGYFPSGMKTFASALNLWQIALQWGNSNSALYIGLTRGKGGGEMAGGGIRLHVRQVMDRE